MNPLERLQQASQQMQANKPEPSASTRVGSRYFHVRTHDVFFDQKQTEAVKKSMPHYADRIYQVQGEKVDLFGNPMGEQIRAFIAPRGNQAIPQAGDVFELQEHSVVNGAYNVDYYQLFGPDQLRMVAMARPGNPRENHNGDVVASVFAVDPQAAVAVPMSSLLDGTLEKHILKELMPWKEDYGKANRVFNDAEGKPVFDPNTPRYGATPNVTVRFLNEEIQLWGRALTRDNSTGETRWANEDEIKQGWQGSQRQQAVHNRLFNEWPETLKSMGMTKENIDQAGMKIHIIPGAAFQVGKRALNGHKESYMPPFGPSHYKVGDTGEQVTFSTQGRDGGQIDVVKDLDKRGYVPTEMRITRNRGNGNWCVDKAKPQALPGESTIRPPVDGVPLSPLERKEQQILQQQGQQAAPAQQQQQQQAPAPQQQQVAPQQQQQAAVQQQQYMDQQRDMARQQMQQEAPQQQQPAPQPQAQQQQAAPVQQPQSAPAQQQAYDPYGDNEQPVAMAPHAAEIVPITDEDLASLDSMEFVDNLGLEAEFGGVEYDEVPNIPQQQQQQQAFEQQAEQQAAPRKRPSGLTM